MNLKEAKEVIEKSEREFKEFNKECKFIQILPLNLLIKIESSFSHSHINKVKEELQKAREFIDSL